MCRLDGSSSSIQWRWTSSRSLLIGQDASKIEHYRQRMRRHGFRRGGVVLGSAISGIDQALWDLKGKRLGVPAYELFGGPSRERVRVYTHVGGTTPEAAAKHARERRRAGFHGVGPDLDLMLDTHGQPASGDAIELGRALAPFWPLFCHAGGLTELRKIAPMAAASDIKVAPHNPNGPVATITSVHLAASIPNFLILEMAHQPLRDEIQRYGLTISNGCRSCHVAPVWVSSELDPLIPPGHGCACRAADRARRRYCGSPLPRSGRLAHGARFAHGRCGRTVLAA